MESDGIVQVRRSGEGYGLLPASPFGSPGLLSAREPMTARSRLLKQATAGLKHLEIIKS